MIKGILMSFFTLFFCFGSFSQQKLTTQQYIEQYSNIAVKQMKDYKIPASIILAQGILESGNGNSRLAREAKNHFGIKCHSDWTGKRFYMDDDAKNECFRVYKSPVESYRDHSLFLTTRSRYAFLFTDYKTTDYKKWAHGLKSAGYATNPKYPTLLIDLIEKNELYKYDKAKYVPNSSGEDILEMDEIKDADFVLEKSDAYIKALMGRNVYFSDREKGVFIFNRIKTIKAAGRTPLEIAIEFDLNYQLLLKYNEINAENFFKADQNVFLQPKRHNGSQKDYMVKPGDSMWEISQMFGIKLNQLYNKNLMNIGEQPKPGAVLSLRKKLKVKVATIKYEDVLKDKKKVEAEKAKSIANSKAVPISTPAKVEEKKVVVETPVAVVKPVVNKVETVESAAESVYPKEKYVDKNEQMTKIIDEIPVVDKNTTTISGEERELFILHTVVQGETLYFISRKYGVSVEKIKKDNNLLDNTLDIGKELIISHKE